jgi:hypothetical protein
MQESYPHLFLKIIKYLYMVVGCVPLAPGPELFGRWTLAAEADLDGRTKVGSSKDGIEGSGPGAVVIFNFFPDYSKTFGLNNLSLWREEKQFSHYCKNKCIQT